MHRMHNLQRFNVLWSLFQQRDITESISCQTNKYLQLALLQVSKLQYSSCLHGNSEAASANGNGGVNQSGSQKKPIFQPSPGPSQQWFPQQLISGSKTACKCSESLYLLPAISISVSAIAYFNMHRDAEDMCLVPSCFKRPCEQSIGEEAPCHCCPTPLVSHSAELADRFPFALLGVTIQQKHLPVQMFLPRETACY